MSGGVRLTKEVHRYKGEVGNGVQAGFAYVHVNVMRRQREYDHKRGHKGQEMKRTLIKYKLNYSPEGGTQRSVGGK